MATTSREWEINCDLGTSSNVRKEEKFPYIVALARAVNALKAAHSLLPSTRKAETPERLRNIMNSYFFSSALLYEGLRLIRRMNREFADDEVFQTGLRMLFKDPTALKIERDHLNPARNHAVFHFLPDEFRKAICKSDADRIVFVMGAGKKARSLHYGYADVLAAEILVGMSSDDPKFWATFNTAAKETGELVIKFTDDAELLIGTYLRTWGFKRE
jgi:hypothetical protein